MFEVQNLLQSTRWLMRSSASLCVCGSLVVLLQKKKKKERKFRRYPVGKSVQNREVCFKTPFDFFLERERRERRCVFCVLLGPTTSPLRSTTYNNSYYRWTTFLVPQRTYGCDSTLEERYSRRPCRRSRATKTLSFRLSLPPRNRGTLFPKMTLVRY